MVSEAFQKISRRWALPYAHCGAFRKIEMSPTHHVLVYACARFKNIKLRAVQRRERHNHA